MTAAPHLPHVAVLGGGIIGSSIAWRLAQRGCRVDLVDAAGVSRAHRSATWASAGLLAPGVEAEPTEDALHALCERSLGLWPEFARELEMTANVPLDFRDSGALVVALTRDDVVRLQHAHAFHERLGTTQQWLSRDQLAEREPNLAGTALAARYLPNDRQVNPRAALTALQLALRSAGVTTHDQVVASISLDGARPRVAGQDWHLDADLLVIAAGAWSRDVSGIPEAWRPRVHPVKGQMLSVELPDQSALLRHAVFTPRVYLVPRASGALLVGATVEDRGFDGDITAGGLLHLLEGAWRALPAIESARVVETWCGFRPGSRDDAPLLGFRDERLIYATGHYRNGILLAPATADAIAECVVTGRAPEWIHAFAPHRFDDAHD